MAHIPCAEKLDYYPPWTENVTCSASDNITIAAYGGALCLLCRCAAVSRALTRLCTSVGWKKDFQVLLENPDPVHTLEAAPAAAPRALFMTACLQHEERTTAGWTGLKAGGVRLRDAFAAFHAACASGSSGCLAERKLYLDDVSA